MVKKLIKIALVVVVLVVLLLIAGVIWIDSLVKAGVERGGTYALGVDTKLDSASVGLLSGKLGLSGLEVKNPQGYQTPHFVSLKQGDVAVSLGSLRSDVVEVPKFELTGIDMYMEKKDGKANYQAILDNLKRFEGQKDQPQPATKEAKPGKKFLIKQVAIRDVKVHFDLPVVGKTTVAVPEVVLNNVGTADGKGMQSAEVTGAVIKAIMLAALENGKNIIPKDVAGEITNGLAGLESLASGGVEIAGKLGQDISQGVGKGVDEAAKALGNVGKGAGKVVDDLGKGLGDLLKPKDEKKK